MSVLPDSILQERRSDIMIFQSKECIHGLPVWSVDTDTQTVTHIHPKTFETEEHKFFHDYIRYHLHYLEDEAPHKLQRLVDNGEIYQYLSDLDTKVFDAVDRQEELLKANDKELQSANERGDIVTAAAIANAYHAQARDMVFAVMIYTK